MQQMCKDMKQIMVVKRRGQNEHLNKATSKNRFIFYNIKTYIDTYKILQTLTKY